MLSKLTFQSTAILSITPLPYWVVNHNLKQVIKLNCCIYSYTAAKAKQQQQQQNKKKNIYNYDCGVLLVSWSLFNSCCLNKMRSDAIYTIKLCANPLTPWKIHTTVWVCKYLECEFSSKCFFTRTLPLTCRVAKWKML